MATSRSTRSSTRRASSPGRTISGVISAEEASQKKATKRRQISEQNADTVPPSVQQILPITPPKKRARPGLQDAAPPGGHGSPRTGAVEVNGASSMPPPPTSSARPADPRTTSAPLTTPRGTRYTAYPLPPPASSSVDASGQLPPPTSTTASLLAEACAHLIATEPKLAPVIARHPCPLFSAEGLAREVEPFRSLASGIIGQQISGAAASSIQRRFVALFDPQTTTEGTRAVPSQDDDAAAEGDRGPFPTPEAVVAMGSDQLRPAGLSQRKAEYIHGLAEKFANGELNAQWLVQAPYEDVVERLTAVRGLGLWSVEMFACFGLKRMDVFSVGDLGVQRGLAALLGKDVKKLKAKGGKWKYASKEEMLDYSSKFAPYRQGSVVDLRGNHADDYDRSLLMWYLWRYEGVDVAVMEKS